MLSASSQKKKICNVFCGHLREGAKHCSERDKHEHVNNVSEDQRKRALGGGSSLCLYALGLPALLLQFSILGYCQEKGVEKQGRERGREGW